MDHRNVEAESGADAREGSVECAGWSVGAPLDVVVVDARQHVVAPKVPPHALCGRVSRDDRGYDRDKQSSAGEGWGSSHTLVRFSESGILIDCDAIYMRPAAGSLLENY